MWYKDTPGYQDKATAASKGFTSRKALTAQSKSVQMMGKLHLDLFCEEKYLLNKVNLKIKLRRNRNVFTPMAETDNYKIKIKDVALFVRSVQLSPAVRMGHVNALEMTSCKYPTYRSQSRYGSTWQHELRPGQYVLGQLPKRLVIGCVDSDA
jgi:hypothetical protein